MSKTGYGGQVTHVDTHYDEQGHVVAVSNPYGSYTRYDALGRIDQLETPAFGSSGNRETTTTGAKVNLTTTKFHGRFTQVTVDAHDRSLQATTTLATAKGQTIAVWNADNAAPALTASNYGETSTAGASLVYALDGAGRMVRTEPPEDKDSVYSYDPWGERRDPEDWDEAVANNAEVTQGGDTDLTPRGYTDHEMLDDMGLVHMNGRIYDPLLGRFLSADRIIDGVYDLQGYNRYSYVKNNPPTEHR